MISCYFPSGLGGGGGTESGTRGTLRCCPRRDAAAVAQGSLPAPSSFTQAPCRNPPSDIRPRTQPHNLLGSAFLWYGPEEPEGKTVPENKQAKNCRASNGVLRPLAAVDELKYPSITLYSWFLTVWLGCNSEASLCLSCLVFVYHFASIKFYTSSNLGKFWPLFLHKFFSAHSLFSPFSVPVTQVLDHLISFNWSLNFCSNFAEFSLLCILHFESF